MIVYFSEYYSQDFKLDQGEVNADVSIKNNEVVVKLNFPFKMQRGEESVNVNSHEIIVDSNLGSLYSSALEIYELEQEKLF